MQLPQRPFSLIVFLIVLMSIMLILTSIVAANAHAYQIERAEWQTSNKRLEVSGSAFNAIAGAHRYDLRT